MTLWRGKLHWASTLKSGEHSGWRREETQPLRCCIDCQYPLFFPGPLPSPYLGGSPRVKGTGRHDAGPGQHPLKGPTREQFTASVLRSWRGQQGLLQAQFHKLFLMLPGGGLRVTPHLRSRLLLAPSPGGPWRCEGHSPPQLSLPPQAQALAQAAVGWLQAAALGLEKGRRGRRCDVKEMRGQSSLRSAASAGVTLDTKE